MSREYCCSECGLIWFDEKMNTNEIKCPECGNEMSRMFPIYPCDSTGWAYASPQVSEGLKSIGREIHYHISHPWYGKKV